MAAGEDDEIAAVLKMLAREDPRVAGVAEAALGWIAGEVGLAAITQARIQNFCWLELPLKWHLDQAEKLAVVAALARALLLLELPRYAGICQSADTLRVLAAYETSAQAGKAAFRQAAAASGITPPDLPEHRWGAVMGSQEAAAWTSVADMLELAIAGGELVPGGRGWRARQQHLTRVHLNAAPAELLGQTRAQVILTERAESWVGDRRSGTRRQIIAGIANRLLHPAELPDGASPDALPRLTWLLGELRGGIALTQAGNLNLKFVQHNAERFGWPFPQQPRSEAAVYELHLLRLFAQRLRLTRRLGGTLGLTRRGRELLADPEQLWRTAAAKLIDGRDFPVFAGELFLAVLASNGQVSHDEVNATVRQAAVEEGFREGRTLQPPGDPDAWWAIYQTSGLCHALGLLAAGHEYGDSHFVLTPVGRSVALEALRARAIGPRAARD